MEPQPRGAIGTTHADGISDGPAAGISASGTVAVVTPRRSHRGQETDHALARKWQAGHQRPAFVAMNDRNDP